MSCLLKLLKAFDIYGEQFSLRINNQIRFKTSIGGTLTIVTIGILILSVYSFFHDFYARLHPKVNTDYGMFDNDKIPYFTQGQTNSTIVFQFPKTIENIQVLKFRNYNLKKGIFGQDYLQRCPYEYVKSIFDLDSEIDDFYTSQSFRCLYLNKTTIGQNTNSKYENFFNLMVSLDNCKKLSNDTKASFDFCKLNQNATVTKFVINVGVDRLGFYPENYENPLQTKIKMTRHIIELNQTVESTITFHVNYLEDDRGWIIEDKYNQTELSLDESFSANLQIGQANLYSWNLNLYVSDNYTRFVRTFSKIQDLLAVVGGFMKVIFATLFIMSFLVRLFLVDNHLINTHIDMSSYKPSSLAYMQLQNQSLQNESGVGVEGLNPGLDLGSLAVKSKKILFNFLDNFLNKDDLQSNCNCNSGSNNNARDLNNVETKKRILNYKMTNSSNFRNIFNPTNGNNNKSI